MKYRFALALLLVLLSGGFAVADYHFAEGYYWQNGVAYNRRIEYSDYYYHCGQYVPRYYSYVYTPVVKAIDPQAYDAEAQLLNIAAARDRVEGKLRQANQKHAAFLEKVDKLGLSGNFYWQNYGIAPQGPAYAAKSLQYGNYGAQGNTVYGYSYNQVADLYGTLDLNTLFQQSASLTKGAQGLADQANQGFTGTLNTVITGANRAEEIKQQGIAAQRVLEASKAAPQGTVRTQIQGLAPDTMPRLDTGPPTGVQARTKPALIREALCAKCHSGANKKGGFDITKYNELSEEHQRYVISIITTADDKFRMPKKDDGSPGTKVSKDYIKAFLEP